MDKTDFTPQLNATVQLKPMRGYALLYGRHPSEISIIDPSHAFLLALCDQGLRATEIAFIYGYTFGLSDEDAKSQVDLLLTRYRQYLTFAVRHNRSERFMPQKFLFPADTLCIESARVYPSEQGRGILGAARGNVGSWRSMRTRSTMPFWRCYG